MATEPALRARTTRTGAAVSVADEPGRTAHGAWSALDLAQLDPARERPYWLALSIVPGVGTVSFARLLAAYGSGEEAWGQADATLLRHLDRATPETVSALTEIRSHGIASFATRLERTLAGLATFVVTALDPGYPAALRELDPRPPVLYARGSLDSLQAVTVAVVGTRRPTGYGRAVAAEIGDELARAGATVVSGLAVGIDGEAHAAAVAAGGKSVAILPSPLDRVYPPRNRGLADALVKGGGALISELPPRRSVGKPDFARRNRIIAGISRATVVVEAPDGSGALLTAAAASAYGRDLHAVPGPIDSHASRGCNRLIADQLATLVTSPQALLHQLGARRSDPPVSISSLSEAEGIVLGALLKRSGAIEELIARTRLPTSALASALTLLEARQLVTCYGGATFHPTLEARHLERQGRLR